MTVGYTPMPARTPPVLLSSSYLRRLIPWSLTNFAHGIASGKFSENRTAYFDGKEKPLGAASLCPHRTSGTSVIRVTPRPRLCSQIILALGSPRQCLQQRLGHRGCAGD